MSRYFIAIPLPDAARDRLIALQPPALSGMRILSRGEFHLTLHFLGDVATHDLAAVRSALATVTMNAFTINLKGIGQFPSERHAKVLWAGVEPSGELLELHRSIAAALADAVGYRPEDRPYSPHVTLARLDEPSPIGLIEHYLERQKRFELASVPIDRFTLFSSRFAGAVPRYEEEADFLLTNAK